VGLVVELVALVAPLLEKGAHLLDGPDATPVGVDAEAEPPQELEHLRLRTRTAGRVDGVHEALQRPARGDARVELAYRSGGGVAGIGVVRFAGLLEIVVEPGEAALGEVGLTAHLDLRWKPGLHRAQPGRDGADGAQLGGDVLALDAVAPSRAASVRPVAVGERDRQAVDLQLADVP